MAGRARLTLEAVLEELDLEEDDFDDEPMMPGSDDEFSDLEEVCLEDAENDNDDDDNGSVTLPQPPPTDTQGSSMDALLCWTSTLTPTTIMPFTSSVGPKVAIPDSPSDIFQLMFTPDRSTSVHR